MLRGGVIGWESCRSSIGLLRILGQFRPGVATKISIPRRNFTICGLIFTPPNTTVEDNGKLITMDRVLFDTLQNTQMREVSSIEDLDRIGDENEKDFKGIKQGIEARSSFNAPIVVKQGDKEPWLVAGNTRLVAAAAYGITPQVWYVKIDENK